MQLSNVLECTLCVLMSGFESAPWVNITNSPPLLTPESKVYIKGLTYEEDFRGSIVSQSIGEENKKLFIGEAMIPADLHWNKNNSSINFTAHSLNTEKSIGLYSYKAGDEKETLIYSLEDAQRDIQNFENTAQIHWINSAGLGHEQSLMRLSDSENNTRYLVRKTKDKATELILAERKNGVSFIFTPKANSNGTGAVKVRYGNEGAVGESNPDEILLITKDKTIRLLEDKDSNAASPYLQFYNTAAINDANTVAVLAKKENSIVFVLIKNDKVSLEIPLPPNEAPTPFNFALNNKDEIAMISSTGSNESVYLWDGKEWKQKAKSGDKLVHDASEVVISNRLPSFHGGISLNDKSEIAVSATLESIKDNAATYTAVLLLK